MGQKFIARERFEFDNGAVGWRPGGPFDCLGPYAKVENCPIEGTAIRRTCYATGYPETYFSVPACTRVNGKYIGGFFSTDRLCNSTEKNLAVEFVPYDRFLPLLPKMTDEEIRQKVMERLTRENYALELIPIPSTDPRDDIAYLKVTPENIDNFPGMVVKLAKEWRIIREAK